MTKWFDTTTNGTRSACVASMAEILVHLIANVSRAQGKRTGPHKKSYETRALIFALTSARSSPNFQVCCVYAGRIYVAIPIACFDAMVTCARHAHTQRRALTQSLSPHERCTHKQFATVWCMRIEYFYYYLFAVQFTNDRTTTMRAIVCLCFLRVLLLDRDRELARAHLNGVAVAV